MDWNVLVNPVVGGIIGYATNYLAIKMLFKPHTAQYIGKIKIPFTPGLIPKEKATLARQMGEITEEYLLTEHMLVDTLTGPKVKDVFLEMANKIPKQMQESDQSIKDFAQSILGDDINIDRDMVIDQLRLEITKMLKSEEVMALVIPSISSAVSEALRAHIGAGLRNNSISPYIKEFGLETLEGEKSKNYIYNTIDKLEEKGYDLLRDNAADIGRGIISAIGEGEEADKIKETLHHWIEENFNPMVSMFIKVDKIYAGIINFAREALEDPQRNSKFGELLCTVMKGIKESEPDYKDKAIDIIKTQINQENIDILVEIVVEEINEKEEATKFQIEQLLYNKWEESINTGAFAHIIKELIGEVAEFIGVVPISKLSAMIPRDTKTQINEKLFSYYKKIIESNSSSVAKVMDISHLVESKINEFSSEEAEKLILSVVKNQLRGITWIGALLGAAIGILSNFLG